MCVCIRVHICTHVPVVKRDHAVDGVAREADLAARTVLGLWVIQLALVCDLNEEIAGRVKVLEVPLLFQLFIYLYIHVCVYIHTQCVCERKREVSVSYR